MNSKYSLLILIILAVGCEQKATQTAENETKQVSLKKPLDWNTATIYFLLTDRFNNGDPSNDLNFDRTKETGVLRNFMGGDIKGITQKINTGYFNDLGVDAIWFSPIFEQIHGAVDEGTGATYAFHGYWPRDWSAIDPNYGTSQDLKEMVATAHSKGVRVVFDVILNHTGPVTNMDPVWPSDWVRTTPQCTYQDYNTTAPCTLVKNLPDVRTEDDIEVTIPNDLAAKWKSEGRYENEIKELDEFFEINSLPRYPRYYIMKWLLDYIKDYGIDGFRVDTAKHLHEDVWAELADLARAAYEEWKSSNSETKLGDEPFYMLGEVYGYGASNKEYYDFGDRKVNYFDHGFNSLINFEFAHDAKNDYENIFTKYDRLLTSNELANKGIVNYVASHDDGNSYDPTRKNAFEAGTKLLLTPGSVQIYYGDETARSLSIEGTVGDATLRSFMNWDALDADSVKMISRHWQKLGQFRQKHAAVSKGKHQMLSESPYTFSRTLDQDQVVVGLKLNAGEKKINVSEIFDDGTEVMDYYSGKKTIVAEGIATIDSEFDIVLLEM